VTAGFGVAGLKAAMDMLGMIGGKPRSPMQPLNDEQKTKLKGILKEAGIL
jgi:4-hydroxy-2-oxoglutarate aldolase